eukprot:GCRY01002164.1.p1 GENE.GCRY01002164.1~~GCRY01002164.1.p1  ORF type:complete len:450 (-),score=82.59 GCRY01002164.1:85-1434(-)
MPFSEGESVDSPLSFTTEDVSFFKFKAEGNANLILTYTGPKLPAGFPFIVRIRKHNRSTCPAECGHRFYHIVKELHLGSFLPSCNFANVTEEFLEQLECCIYEDRPSHRRSIGIDLRQERILISLDATFPFHSSVVKHFPVLAVEIKPKSGVLPDWGVHTDTLQGLCSFCANQHLKLHTQATAEISQYCPLDLFSGKQSRIERALRALFCTPQNNFRLFLDGNVLDLSEKHTVTAVLSAFFAGETAAEGFLELVRVLTNVLMVSPVLARLHLLQALALPNPCHAHDLFTSLLNDECSPTLAVCSACAEGAPLLQTEEIRPFLQADMPLPPPTPTTTLSRLRAHAVGITAKDCSVIIALARNSSRPCLPLSTPTVLPEQENGANHMGEVGLTDCPHTRFSYHVQVVDVDPKHFSRLLGYVERQSKIAESVRAQRSPSPPTCAALREDGAP